jgi:hypothetical protein
MVGNQIPYLTPTLSFDHNSCKSSLNEQCDGTLSIYTSRPFQWYPRGPMSCIFAFPTKVLNICNSHTSVIPKVGMHLGIIGIHPLHSSPFVRVFFTLKHILSLMGPCTSHFIVNPMLRLRKIFYQLKEFCVIVHHLVDFFVPTIKSFTYDYK